METESTSSFRKLGEMSDRIGGDVRGEIIIEHISNEGGVWEDSAEYGKFGYEILLMPW